MLSTYLACLVARRASRRYASTVSELYQGLVGGDRGCLAKSITLVESTNADKQQRAKELLGQVLQGLKERQAKQPHKAISFRIGPRTLLRRQRLELCVAI